MNASGGPTRDPVVSGDLRSVAGRERDAAARLQALGFRVLRVGPWTSVDAPASVWRRTFGIELERRTVRQVEGVPTPPTDHVVPLGVIPIPPSLADVVEEVVLAQPPRFF